MRKLKKLMNDSTEKKVTNWKMHKRKKAFVAFAGVLAVGLGTAGLVYAQSTTAVKSTYPTPPSNTTVNWENEKPLYYEVDQTGKEHPKPELKLGNGDPAWCLGLGVALPNNSTAAQQSETNKIFQALTDEQKAIINNVEFLGRKAGDLEGYAEAQHATYILLDEAKLSINQTKDVIVKDNTLLHDANKIKTGADNLIKEAKKMRELPSFNSQTIQLLQGASKTVTDSKGVLDNFPNVKVNAKGVTEKVSGNNLTLTADKTAPLGETKNAVQFANTATDLSDLPWYVYSTDGDDTGALSQSVGASQDPSRALSSLNINIIGLGGIDFTKVDADTGTNETQGSNSNSLKGAVFGVFYKSNDKPVKWADGTKDYPITLVSGTKADDTNVSVKIGDDLKGFVKNFDKSKGNVYLMETEAPEGYSLSTKKYDVDFDSGKFDGKTSNFVVDEKATDKVNVFNFMFTKVQDVNGSYTGLNGAEFTLTPKDGTKGNAIVATSGTGTDSNGYTVNGLTKFDGEANSKAGNPSKDGIAVGHYRLSETKTPNGLQPINDVDVDSTAIKDKDGKITAYETKITDVATKQVIDDVITPVEKMKDNNVLLNVNLGQLTDKPVTPVVPTIKTKAHTKDGDQKIEVAEISKETPAYDVATLTNVEKGDQLIAQLHRIVKDKTGKVTESKLLKTLNFTVDDETVKKQEAEFETTIDTTKDLEIPDGSTVTYVWTEKDFDKTANPDTDEPKANHDDLENQDQSLVVVPVKPSIDIEKANDKTPDAGNGNYSDKDNNVGVNDHDTEDTYFEVKENAKTKIFFRGTNNGDEPLTHVKIVDKTTNGKIDVKGITYTYNGKKLTINKDGEFELNGKLLVLNPKESIIGSGELGALPDGELHGDKATITGVGVYSKKKVGDDDKWYGKVVKVTPKISTTPSSATPKGSLPTTGSETGDMIMYGGAIVLGLALGIGTVYYMKKKKSTKEEG
ncbi:LPXTG cell wall anchor domain-containing protein [Lactococcus lactis subsp. lactis]|uniref:MSCRAMM family protein n=1 Tax=Lactococcus lactis TaxID=1358 RepID=UPI00223B3D34|nr:SpaA isopeptide-forming pilin-related protein [Lactococcus lactis]MCT0016761.1 LPXTG cell wall anchor domain-containing protein [Lactococcus lactis subsp. lactis]